MRVALNGDVLRREMARRGLTGAELAAVAGLTAATVSHAVTGKNVDHSTIRRLARALSVTPTLPHSDFVLARASGAQREGPATGSTPTAALVGAGSSAGAAPDS